MLKRLNETSVGQSAEQLRRQIARRGWWPVSVSGAMAVTGAVILMLAAGWMMLSSGTIGSIPAGFAKANGRIEVERVDIAPKYAGRVATIRVKEGDFVSKDDVVATIDTSEVEAQLAAAKAAVRRAGQGIIRARAEVALRQAELQLSEAELRRASELQRRDVGSAADLDRRKAQHAVAMAHLRAAEAAVTDAEAGKQAAEAEVMRIEATITDMTLRAPTDGRVEYRLVQPGAVVAAGARVLTLLDLSQTYMTIFLHTASAGRIALGSQARLVLDAAPRYVIPATVVFVAAEAQFTPKTVETADERERLMYRVKLGFDPKLLTTYRSQVKAGLTGEAWVRIADDGTWPDALAVRLPDAG